MVADLAGSRLTLEVDRPVLRVRSARRVSVRLAGPAVKRVVTIVTKLPLNRGELPSEQRLSTADETGIPALLVDIDGVISLWGFPPRLHARGVLGHRRRHRPFPFGRSRPQPARADGELRTGLVLRMGGQGQRLPPTSLGLPGPLPFLTFEERTSVGGIEGRTSVTGIEEGASAGRPGGRGGAAPLEARRDRSLGRAVAGRRVGGRLSRRAHARVGGAAPRAHAARRDRARDGARARARRGAARVERRDHQRSMSRKLAP